MLFFGKEMEINTKNYGKLKVELDNRSKFGNCYYVITNYDNKELSGIIDNNGNEIVPICDAMLSETIIAPNMEDYCFGFKFNDSELLEYYHVRCFEDNAKLILRTSRFDEVPLKIRMIEDNDNYWIWETVSEHPQYALYDFKNKKVTTNFFDKIEFLDNESPYHMAYYEMEVFSNVDYGNQGNDDDIESVVHTTLCGFIDYECNLSSEILDTESEVIYNSYMYGPTTLDERFKKFIDDLREKYLEAFYIKENSINDILNCLYNSPNTSDKIELKKRPKIVEFKPRKNV